MYLRRKEPIKDANLLLNKVFDSLNEAVFIVETGTRVILDVNSAVEKMFGYCRDEIIGASTSCLHLNEEMYRQFATEMAAAYAVSDVYETTFQMRRRDGSVFDSEHCVTPIRDEDGITISHVCVVRDISDRTKAEKALKASALEQAAILDNTCVGIALVRERRFVWVNNRLLEMLGYDEGELSGMPSRAVYSSEETYAAVGETAYATVAKGIVYDSEFELIRKDGSTFWAKCYGRAMDPSNMTAGTIWVLEDISKRKIAEAALAGKSRALEELNRTLEERIDKAVDELRQRKSELATALAMERTLNEEQRQFIGLISHELRTPLSVIDGAAQVLMLSACEDSECIKLARRIRGASTQLTSLVDTCLTEERIASSGWVPDLQNENLLELVETLAALCQKASDKHRIVTDVISLPIAYQCDAALIKVMLSNLLENAIKYSPVGGVIKLRGKAGNSGEIILEVFDQGVGIAPEHLDKIFDRFYRTWDVTDVPGAGLGLHLVRKIAGLHGGEVRCTSQPGTGSTFTVTLPSG